MSNLLSQASLVMIPSGYKEDVVYSQIPTDGSGDLSFTRASNGTRINSAGLVEDVPWNLNTNSEDFATGWSGANRDYTANATISPNGTTTADQLGATGGNAYYFKVITSSAGQNSFSVYLKYGNRQTQQIYAYSSGSYFAQAVFDLQNGTISSVLFGSATIENIGNGWYRCTISGESGSTSIEIGIEKIAVSTYTYAWGAQLNIGSTAKPYFPTTDRLNVPRLTYQNGGGGCPSLLLEPQRTNVETWSEDFSNASWTKTNSSITANTTTSPDGTQNADKIIENSANGVHFVFNVGATISVAQTLSVYAKADTRTQLALQLGASSVIYNLSSGTIVSGSGGTITSVGNGWYRCAITTTPANTNALIFTANGGTNSYQGDGTSGLFIWGAQLEAGAYPTSYIPTTSSSATRVADDCSKTGIGSLLGGNEGTWFLDMKCQPVTSSTFGTMVITDGASINIALLANASNALRIRVNAANDTISSVNVTNRHKIAISFNAYGVVCFFNGVQLTLPNTESEVVSGLTDINLFTSSRYNNIDIYQMLYFQTRLTNAELQSLTTL